MQSERGSYVQASGDEESPQVHTEITAVQIDSRLLPIYEEHQRHKMNLELRKQEDTTKVVLQQIADTTAITKRGQTIAGLIAILSLIGGFVLIAVDKDAAGATVLVMDAVFVFTQKLVPTAVRDTGRGKKDQR